MNELDDFYKSTEDCVTALKDEIAETYISDITGLYNGCSGEEINIKKCDSPIERMMYLALMHTYRFSYSSFYFVMTPQYKMKRGKGSFYYGDFHISFGDAGKRVTAIVEVDGHEFHEKTKEQVRKDKARERFMTTQVDHVIRFSGSEVFSGAVECANEVFEILVDDIMAKLGMI